MRAPATTLVVDVAVLISAAFGRSSAVIRKVQGRSVLVTTERAVQEARRRIELGMKRADLLQVVDELMTAITVAPAAALEPLLAQSETALRDAVASCNGSTRDAHILALAWSVGGDIWTADRDFAGTGVASWSTPNLLRAFAEAEAERT